MIILYFIVQTKTHIFLYWTNAVYRYNTKTSVAQMSRIFSATAPAQKMSALAPNVLKSYLKKSVGPKKRFKIKVKSEIPFS